MKSILIYTMDHVRKTIKLAHSRRHSQHGGLHISVDGIFLNVLFMMSQNTSYLGLRFLRSNELARDILGTV